MLKDFLMQKENDVGQNHGSTLKKKKHIGEGINEDKAKSFPYSSLIKETAISVN